MKFYSSKFSSNRHSVKEAGFTLMELLIVVAIIGLAAALGIPNYLQWNARYQLKQATTELQTSLSLARMAAMNQNTTVIATPTIASGQLNVAFTNLTGGTVLQPVIEVVREITTITGGPVQFNSLGLRVGGGAGIQTVTLVNRQGLTYSVGITPGGKVRWCASSTCT
jgi:type IV fimbrial biogenesis protein FimT